MNYAFKRIKQALPLLILILAVFAIPHESMGEEQKLTSIKEFTAVYKLEGNIEGDKSHYSQDYGRRYCLVENSVMTVQGNPPQKRNEKTIIYVENGEQWVVTINMDDNTGTKMLNPTFQVMTADLKNKSPEDFSVEYLQNMGATNKGEKTVNGEKCTMWEVPGGAKTCITKDMISIENSVSMGPITMKETAVKVDRKSGGPKGICDIGDAKLKEVDITDMMGP